MAKMEHIRTIKQMDFLDRIKLQAPEINDPYDQSIKDFFRVSAGESMRLIGEIYVPSFDSASHEDFEQSMKWLHTLDIKNPKERFKDGFVNPDYLEKSAHRVQRLFDSYGVFGKKDQNRLVTYSDTSLLEKDLRRVLNPFYEAVRVNSINLFHHSSEDEISKVSGSSTSVILDRTNRMFMSNGELNYQEGMDMLIGYLFFLYSKSLAGR